MQFNKRRSRGTQQLRMYVHIVGDVVGSRERLLFHLISIQLFGTRNLMQSDVVDIVV